MDEQRFPNQGPQIRLLVACRGSGSSLLMKIFAESPVCAVTSRLILMGNAREREGSTPDYSILENPSQHSAVISAMNLGKRFLISQEVVGISSEKGVSADDLCPASSTYAMVRPIFLIRDSIQLFDSWKNSRWTDGQSLIECCDNLFRMLHQSPPHSVSCLLFEHVIQDPQTEVKRICTQWGVPYSESMLPPKQPFGPSFTSSTDEASFNGKIDVLYHGLLSNIEKDLIEKQLSRRCVRCWQGDISRLRAILRKKTWFGFDLDDILHEFSRSAKTAANRVLEKISERYGTPVPLLGDEYLRVRKEKTANGFSDGKTSFDYRKGRFATLLAYFSLPQDDQFMAELLDLYEATLMASLELKCGALGLLSAVRNMGKKIFIMTEGPQDAQERVVQTLGIGGYIDFLASTNHFRVTKINGLFSKVLEHLSISPDDLAYIGDDEERDMKPAMAQGIFTIHLAEAKHVSLNALPPQINTLRKLQYILSNEDP